MVNKKLYQSHDKMAKTLFSDRENAADYLKATLPKNIQQKLLWESLALENNSYIDSKLTENFSDIVYSCDFNTKYGLLPIKVSFLFEHKSQYAPYIHLQLLQYKLNIWFENINQEQRPQIVIPLVFYHGQEKWLKRSLSSYFSDTPGVLKDLEIFIPEFDYLLTDLSQFTNEQIKDQLFDRVIVKTTMLIMKNIYNQQSIEQNLIDFLALSEQYFATDRGLDFLQAIILYLFNQTKINRDNIVEDIKKISGEGARMAQSTAENLIEQGLEQGEKRKALDSARRMKKKGLDIQLIHEVTGLPIEEIEQL